MCKYHISYPGTWAAKEAPVAKLTLKYVLSDREGNHMYYVIQTAPGKERETEQMIEKLVNRDLYTRCFFLTRDMRRKFHGKFRVVTQKLLPGYVFLESEDIRGLYMAAKQIPTLLRFLGREEDLFVALNPTESEWVDRLTTQGAHVPLSKVCIRTDLKEGDGITILSEPLAGLAGYLKKIDRHRSHAEIEIEFMGEKRTIYLGVEFIEKADEMHKSN